MESEIDFNPNNNLVEIYINPDTTVDVNTLDEILKKIGYQLYYMNKIGNDFQILSDKCGEFLNCCYEFVLSCNDLKEKEPEFCHILEHIMSFVAECHLFIIKFKYNIPEEKIKKSASLFMEILPKILNRFLHKDGYMKIISDIEDFVVNEHDEEYKNEKYRHEKYQKIFNKRRSIINKIFEEMNQINKIPWQKNNKISEEQNEVDGSFLLCVFEENKFDTLVESMNQFLKFDIFERSIYKSLDIKHGTNKKLDILVKKHNVSSFKILTSIIKEVGKNINNISSPEYYPLLPRYFGKRSEFFQTELGVLCCFFRIFSIIFNITIPLEIEEEIKKYNSYDIFNLFHVSRYNFQFMRSFIEMITQENKIESRELICEYINQIIQITNSILKIIIKINKSTV